MPSSFGAKLKLATLMNVGIGTGLLTHVQVSPSSPGAGTVSASSTQHHPQRVAMWFTWGDLGYTGVKTTCGNRLCCNPFHLIPQKVGVFVDHESFSESFELQCELTYSPSACC